MIVRQNAVHNNLAKSLRENSDFAPALKLKSEIQNYLQSEVQ